MQGFAVLAGNKIYFLIIYFENVKNKVGYMISKTPKKTCLHHVVLRHACNSLSSPSQTHLVNEARFQRCTQSLVGRTHTLKLALSFIIRAMEKVPAPYDLGRTLKSQS